MPKRKNKVSSDPVFDQLCKIPANEAVCHYLQQKHPSAHSDLVDELFDISRHLTEQQHYCPNPQRYAYFILYTTSGVVFAVAVGMLDLVFHLPNEAVSEALVDGGEAFSDLPTEWVTFDEATPPNRLKRWCEVAYRNALSL